MRKSVRRQVHGDRRTLELASVLLVHGELASRLALQTILQAGGYLVDAAASAAEALAKLDEGHYDLVLAESGLGAQTAGCNVLGYARVKDYRPATAMITCFDPAPTMSDDGHEVSIYAENLPLFLGKVAELIGLRASRRYPALRQAV